MTLVLDTMAAATVGGRERDRTMTQAALFTIQYFFHPDVVGPFFRLKNCRVAIRAFQPQCVHLVGEKHHGHAALLIHHDFCLQHR